VTEAVAIIGYFGDRWLPAAICEPEMMTLMMTSINRMQQTPSHTVDSKLPWSQWRATFQRV